jgi:formate hydrogenlyase subunit 6/NADH:ubiquinone oxidoreductase subunit I
MPLGEDKNCINCGLCVSTCPVGALTPRNNTALPTTAYTDRAHLQRDEKITSITDAVKQATLLNI